MNNVNPSVIVAAIFALVLIIAIFRFKGELSAALSALGVKLTLRGRNSGKSMAKPASIGGGIRRNWLFGKVTAKTKGGARIEDNTAAGNIDLEAEERTPSDETPDPRKPSR
jgi:hypothetical protein